MTKRVALVTNHFPSIGQPYIFAWVKAMRKAGLDVTVLTENLFPQAFPLLDSSFDEWRPHIRLLNSLNHPLNSLTFNWRPMLRQFLHPRQLTRSLLLLKRSFKTKTFLLKTFEYFAILDETFALVHFNAPQIAVRRFELGQLLEAKTLVSFRGQDISFNATKYDGLLRNTEHLHFISNHLVELAKERSYTGDKHTLIPPMLDVDFYHPASVEQNIISLTPSLTLFTAARFHWSKGWEFALQAIALLVERGWDIHYEIAGEGKFDGGRDQHDTILFTIHQLGLQERVKLLGWLSPEQVRERMRQADLYLLASVEEGFNNSILQAQSCGLPVVCSDAGGLPENIEDGKTGLLFHRRDAWDMADKIETLLSNPEMRQQMGQAARERAGCLFSMQSSITAFINLYQRLAD